MIIVFMAFALAVAANAQAQQPPYRTGIFRPPPSTSPPPPLPYYLEVDVSPGVSYRAHSDVLSENNIITNVINSNGDLVLTVEFLKTTVVPILPNNTNLPTLDIPNLLNAAINEYVITSINTVATYIAAQVVFALTTVKTTRRTLLRSLLDNPGCDLFPDTACTIPCCAQHDKCYHDNGCTSLSWIYGSSACINCNNIVVNCVFSSPSSCSECAGLTPKGESCYDNKCNIFYDCPGSCPCSLTSTPSNGCCECPSPCQKSPTPTPTQTPTPVPTPTPTLSPPPKYGDPASCGYGPEWSGCLDPDCNALECCIIAEQCAILGDQCASNSCEICPSDC